MPPFQSFPKSYLATSPSHYLPNLHPPKNCSISYPLPYYRCTALPRYLGTSSFLILFRISTTPSHHPIIMDFASLLTLTWGAFWGGGSGGAQSHPVMALQLLQKINCILGPLGGFLGRFGASSWGSKLVQIRFERVLEIV